MTTVITYNNSNLPLTATSAYGTADAKTVHYYYNAQGDLAAFDPPSGSTGRVQFEYLKYNKNASGSAPTKQVPDTYVGQVTRTLYPDGTSTYAGYDAAEQLDWTCSADLKYTQLWRDSLHRVYQVDYPARGAYAAFSATCQFDEFGRVTVASDAAGTSTSSYDDANRLVTFTPPVGLGATYSYLRDTVNQRWISRVSLTGKGTWEYRADGKGRLSGILNPLGQATTFSYDVDGKPLRETRANGTYTDYSYTSRDWLSGIQHRYANGSVLDTFSYYYTDAGGTYDPTGHLRREVDGGSRTHAFSYDNLYRLTSESHPDFGTLTYGYDANGNRTSKIGSAGTDYSGYDTQNKLLWVNRGTNAAPTSGQANPYRKYTYDLNGNPTTVERKDASGLTTDTLGWDGFGKLRSLTSTGAAPGTYTATYSGHTRVSSVINGTAHTYSYGAGLLHDSAGDTLYTPGVSQRKSGVDRYFHSDWLGSTRYLTDATGNAAPTAYRFDSFGNLSATAGLDSTSSKFAGRAGYESDGPAGLQMLGARYYDPAVGRFLSPDPIGFAGGLNRYAYCYGNPVGAVDPSGLLATGPAPNLDTPPVSNFPEDPGFEKPSGSGSSLNAYPRTAMWALATIYAVTALSGDNRMSGSGGARVAASPSPHRLPLRTASIVIESTTCGCCTRRSRSRSFRTSRRCCSPSPRKAERVRGAAGQCLAESWSISLATRQAGVITRSDQVTWFVSCAG